MKSGGSVLTWILFLLSVSLFGCQSGAERAVAVFPVDGQLLHLGQPARGAVIAFFEADNESSKPISEAVVKDDGHFVPVQADGAIGLPAGRYILTAVWDQAGTDRFGGKYASRDSPLTTIQVRESINFLPPIKLK